jgi:hypothetical protein
VRIARRPEYARRVASIPAICDDCGAVFGTESALSVEGATNLTLVDFRVGPCPVCGGTGRIPDGVYSFIGDSIRVLSAPAWSIPKLARLRAVLEAAGRTGAPPRQVAQKVAQEAPDLAAVLEAVTRQGRQAAWLAILLAVVQLLLSYAMSEQDPPEASEIARQVAEELRRQPVLQTPRPATRRSTPRPPDDARGSARKKRPPKTKGKAKKKRNKRR